jgi:L-lactate dehydrogenase complex protein LldG
MSDQRTLLGRVAANLRRAGGPTSQHVVPPPLALATDDAAALRARFAAEWRALAGHLHDAPSLADAARIVADVCRVRGTATVLGWSETAIGIEGLERALAAEGIGVDHGDLPRDPAERVARVQSLASIAVGLTGADALLAESGSIVVAGGPGRPRLASLLPAVHVTLVRAPRLFLSLEHLLAADPALASAGSNMVAISGPSRTADIEMTLTRGVHGPGEVHVVFVGA